MKKGFEIVKPVLERFPGLPEKLSHLFGKSKTWWYSHGYPLKKDDPIANGNLSAVDHILKMCDRYEAGENGAGKMLAENLIAELRARFHAGCESGEISDREIRQDLFTQFFEAVNELDKSNLKDKTILELGKSDSELADIENAIGRARATVRSEKRRKEAGINTLAKFNGK